MSESDSFLQEVSEEVRRDQLIGFLRRNAVWIGIGVAAVIAAAGTFEYLKATARAEAQANGTAIWQAANTGDAAARAAALETAALSDGAAHIRDFQLAAAKAEAGETRAALDILLALAGNPDVEPDLQDVARLKYVSLGASEVGAAERLDILARVTAEGHRMRPLALEQQALIHLEQGDTAAAAAALEAIVDDPLAGVGPRNRADQLLSIIGGDANDG